MVKIYNMRQTHPTGTNGSTTCRPRVAERGSSSRNTAHQLKIYRSKGPFWTVIRRTLALSRWRRFSRASQAHGLSLARGRRPPTLICQDSACTAGCRVLKMASKRHTQATRRCRLRVGVVFGGRGPLIELWKGPPYVIADHGHVVITILSPGWTLQSVLWH